MGDNQEWCVLLIVQFTFVHLLLASFALFTNNNYTYAVYGYFLVLYSVNVVVCSFKLLIKFLYYFISA